jgi:hypothetical protein
MPSSKTFARQFALLIVNLLRAFAEFLGPALFWGGIAAVAFLAFLAVMSAIEGGYRSPSHTSNLLAALAWGLIGTAVIGVVAWFMAKGQDRWIDRLFYFFGIFWVYTVFFGLWAMGMWAIPAAAASLVLTIVFAFLRHGQRAAE